MKKNKETINEIAISIDAHSKQEVAQQMINRVIARVNCDIIKSTIPSDFKNLFWITNNENTVGISYNKDIHGRTVGSIAGRHTTLTTDGMPIYKNTRIGEILTKFYSGEHEYSTMTNYGKRKIREITIRKRENS